MAFHFRTKMRLGAIRLSLSIWDYAPFLLPRVVSNWTKRALNLLEEIDEQFAQKLRVLGSERRRKFVVQRKASNITVWVKHSLRCYIWKRWWMFRLCISQEWTIFERVQSNPKMKSTKMEHFIRPKNWRKAKATRLPEIPFGDKEGRAVNNQPEESGLSWARESRKRSFSVRHRRFVAASPSASPPSPTDERANPL